MSSEETEIHVVPAGKKPYSWKGSVLEVADHEHVHNDRGECIKNRYGTRCSRPKKTEHKEAPRA